MKKPRITIIGAVIVFWLWSHDHLTTPETGLTTKAFDNLCGLKGFAQAMISVGWLAEDEQGLLVATGDSLVPIEKSVKNREAEYEKKRPMTEAEKAKAYRDRKKAKANRESSPARHYVGDDASPERHQKSDEFGDEKSDASPYKDKENKNTLSGSATVLGEERQNLEREQIRDEKFGAWLAALCDVNPTTQRMRSLPPSVTAAALAMWQTGFEPTKDELDLLRRFYSATLKDEDDKRGVWRPRKMEQYFSQLPDVIGVATQWAKYWGKPVKATPSKPQKGAESTSAEAVDDEAGSMADWEAIRRMSGIPYLEQPEPTPEKKGGGS